MGKFSGGGPSIQCRLIALRSSCIQTDLKGAHGVKKGG